MVANIIERVKNYVNRLFENSGSYIKKYAKVLFWIEVIAIWITAVVMLFLFEEFGMPFLFALLMFAITVALAIPVAWLSVVPLYAFGEIVDRLCSIDRNTRGEAAKSQTQARLDDERSEKLERLRAQGMITEAEYQQALAKN